MGYAEHHAEHYDRLYDWKDYEAEATRLVALLGEAGLPEDARALEVACGTGAWLEALLPYYEVAGLDLEPAMVRLARRRLPGVEVRVGDMRAFEVDAPYDLLLCMFSSIGYLQPEALPGALRAFHDAVRPGGFVVIEPWLTPGAFKPGHVHGLQHSSEGICVSRQTCTRLEGRVSILDFAFLVTRPGGHEVFYETHRMHLVEVEELRAALVEAGLEPTWHPEGLTGRGLWIARRPGA